MHSTVCRPQRRACQGPAKQPTPHGPARNHLLAAHSLDTDSTWLIGSRLRWCHKTVCRPPPPLQPTGDLPFYEE